MVVLAHLQRRKKLELKRINLANQGVSIDGPSFSRWSKILLFQITRHFNFSRICVVKVIYLEKTKHLIIWNEMSASHRGNMVFNVPLEPIVYIKIILVLYIQVLKFENS
jgi:hypothetical protein